LFFDLSVLGLAVAGQLIFPLHSKCHALDFPLCASAASFSFSLLDLLVGFLDFLRVSLYSISSGATGFGSCRLGVDFQ
jgi:hypothetical protein